MYKQEQGQKDRVKDSRKDNRKDSKKSDSKADKMQYENRQCDSTRGNKTTECKTTESKAREWRLPKDASDFIQNNINKHNANDINLYLAQNRYCWLKTKDKHGNKRPHPLLMDLVEDGDISSNELHLGPLLEERINKNKELTAAFIKRSEYIACFPGRIILGEGGTTPYSSVVAMKFHPLYGVPFVPASTIKGALRSCWNALYDKEEEAGECGMKTEDLLFGVSNDNSREGKLIFFDAFPEEFTLTLDMENPHYPEYYGKGKNPTDDQRTKPISIICMEKVKLPLHLACTDTELWDRQEKKIKIALRQMVEVYGIGAKTALGYGVGWLM